MILNFSRFPQFLLVSSISLSFLNFSQFSQFLSVLSISLGFLNFSGFYQFLWVFSISLGFLNFPGFSQFLWVFSIPLKFPNFSFNFSRLPHAYIHSTEHLLFYFLLFSFQLLFSFIYICPPSKPSYFAFFVFDSFSFSFSIDITTSTFLLVFLLFLFILFYLTFDSFLQSYYHIFSMPSKSSKPQSSGSSCRRKANSIPKPLPVTASHSAQSYMVIDATLPSHIINDRSLFTTYTPGRKVHRTAFGHDIIIEGTGDAHIRVLVAGQYICFRMRNCWHVPSSPHHFLSCATVTSTGHQVMIATGTPRILFPSNRRVAEPRLPKYVPLTTIDGYWVFTFELPVWGSISSQSMSTRTATPDAIPLHMFTSQPFAAFSALPLSSNTQSSSNYSPSRALSLSPQFDFFSSPHFPLDFPSESLSAPQPDSISCLSYPHPHSHSPHISEPLSLFSTTYDLKSPLSNLQSPNSVISSSPLHFSGFSFLQIPQTVPISQPSIDYNKFNNSPFHSSSESKVPNSILSFTLSTSTFDHFDYHSPYRSPSIARQSPNSESTPLLHLLSSPMGHRSSVS
jgi:hypothetical protein